MIDSANKAGKGLYLVRRLRLLSELKHPGATVIKKASDISIGDHQISYRNYRGHQHSFDSDHVTVAQGATGDTTLSDDLRNSGFKTHTAEYKQSQSL